MTRTRGTRISWFLRFCFVSVVLMLHSPREGFVEAGWRAIPEPPVDLEAGRDQAALLCYLDS
jgi:hypothetical protein